MGLFNLLSIVQSCLLNMAMAKGFLLFIHLKLKEKLQQQLQVESIAINIATSM